MILYKAPKGSAYMNDKNYIYFDVRDNREFSKQAELQCRIKPNFDLEGENGEIIYGRKLSYLGRGVNSTVWKYERDGKKYAIKIFFTSCLECALAENVYRIMKPLSLKNTIKALDTLKVLNSGGNKVVGHDAYIMEFLEEKKDYSMVEMPTQALLENTSLLESDAHLLASNKIKMNDVKRENTIFNNNDAMLYIGDIDRFDLSKSSRKSITNQNYSELQFIYYQFFTRYSTDYYNAIYNDLFKELFYQDTTHEKPITDKLEDLFSPYDTPKQFFKVNKDRYYNQYYKKYLE